MFRFGVFEADVEAGELRKQGLKIKLQEQPFKILELLLQKPGEIVTREELRVRVWPADTFVEFDQGLYSAIARLREALTDSAASPRFVETVARRGYRFIAPVVQAGVQEDQSGPRPQPESQNVLRPRHKMAVLVGAALLLVAVLVWRTRELPGGSSRPIRSLAVLPLETLSRDLDQEFFADGITDELTTDLARLGTVRVVSRTSAMRYKKTQKPVGEVARELGVDAIIEGTVERSANVVRLRVQLIQAATDQHLWAETYTREMQDALLLETEAAQDIVRKIEPTFANRRPQRLASPRGVDPEAYEAYLQGLYFSNKRSARNFERALRYFEQAIDRDPGYGAAYSRLSEVLIGQIFIGTPPAQVRERATWAALKAVEIDPLSPEAHDALARVREILDWDWPGAEVEYRRAIELDPSFTSAHQGYAIFLAFQRRFDAALAESQRAQDLDPLSPFVRTTYCLNLHSARQWERAIQKCREALELDPDFLHAHGNLHYIYEAMGRYDEAFREYATAAALSAKADLPELKAAYKRGGIAAFWRKQLNDALRTGGREVEPYSIASLYCVLGDKDRAWYWLEKAYRDRSPHLEEISTDPSFDHLRSDSRFGELMRSMHWN